MLSDEGPNQEKKKNLKTKTGPERLEEQKRTARREQEGGRAGIAANQPAGSEGVKEWWFVLMSQPLAGPLPPPTPRGPHRRHVIHPTPPLAAI